MEQCVEEFFAVDKGVCDVLAGVEQCVEEFFGVKCVCDVLAGRWSSVLRSSLVSSASVTCLLDV